MCFMMGLAAGGMLPVANALLAEIMPTKHRGWCLVLLGGIGTIGGYYATSELSALLQPHFGWRIMWLIGFPTGLILIWPEPAVSGVGAVSLLLEKGCFEEARRISFPLWSRNHPRPPQSSGQFRQDGSGCARQD